MSTHGVVKNIFWAHKPAPVECRRVYVWELPVRVTHWINAVALVLVCITGYLIASGGYHPYWPGGIRFTHLVSAYVLIFSFLARLYWGLVGNQYAKWNSFLPFTKKQWQEIVDVIKTYVLRVKKRGPISIGHNSLAAFIYFLTYVALVAETVTGFALYSSMSTWWLPRMFTWVVPLLGGMMAVHYWHHVFLWFFVAFIIAHVCVSFYHDQFEGYGTISSIVSGWKFVREERPEQAEAE